MKKIIILLLVLSLVLTSLTSCTSLGGYTVLDVLLMLIDIFEDDSVYEQYGQGGKYRDALTYKFTDSDIERGEVLYNTVKQMLDSAEPYDPQKHGIESDIKDSYIAFEKACIQYSDFLTYVYSQMQIADLMTFIDPDDELSANEYQKISEYYNSIESKFNSLAEPIYGSMYREFYYEGMTDEELELFMSQSKAAASKEYLELVNRKSDIELTYIESDGKINDLYEEYVENNNRIARLLGYDNYMEYAYDSIYDRDYSYSDITKIEEYVKKYISKCYIDIDSTYETLYFGDFFNFKKKFEADCLIMENLFADEELKDMFIEYTETMEFTQKDDKRISFSDSFYSLMDDANLFFGDYPGAYVTYVIVDGVSIPFAYFGDGYNNSTSVAHEFGHYMNELYNTEHHPQSYDLLEIHSQGNELLYLNFLADKLEEDVYELYESYILMMMLDSAVVPLTVNSFERAVYTNTYSGTYSDQIMKDGKITANEYDKLYEGILKDFGIYELQELYDALDYWEYVVIEAPCYYVSYSLSALSALEIYMMADADDAAARDSYLKLFTYIDENEAMTSKEILEYAGLTHYNDESLYKRLSEFLSRKKQMN